MSLDASEEKRTQRKNIFENIDLLNELTELVRKH